MLLLNWTDPSEQKEMRNPGDNYHAERNIQEMESGHNHTLDCPLIMRDVCESEE